VYESLVEVKLNDVIEVVGVLSADPSLAEFAQTSKYVAEIMLLVVNLHTVCEEKLL